MKTKSSFVGSEAESLASLLRDIGYNCRFAATVRGGSAAEMRFFKNPADLEAGVVRSGVRGLFFYQVQSDGTRERLNAVGPCGVSYTLIKVRWRPRLRQFEVLVLVKVPGQSSPTRLWYRVDILRVEMANN